MSYGTNIPQGGTEANVVVAIVGVIVVAIRRPAVLGIAVPVATPAPLP